MKKCVWLGTIFLVFNYAVLAYAAPKCSFKSITSVNFGNYNPLSPSNDNSTGSIDIRCTGNPSSYSLTLSKGQSNSYNPRKLSNGSQTLNYNLYLNAARTQIWGDGTSGTSYFTGSGNHTNDPPLPVYGKIPGGQDAAVGSYSDNIIATLNF